MEMAQKKEHWKIYGLTSTKINDRHQTQIQESQQITSSMYPKRMGVCTATARPKHTHTHTPLDIFKLCKTKEKENEERIS